MSTKRRKPAARHDPVADARAVVGILSPDGTWLGFAAVVAAMALQEVAAWRAVMQAHWMQAPLGAWPAMPDAQPEPHPPWQPPAGWQKPEPADRWEQGA